MAGTVEFRMPISPTKSFFGQLRFFNYGLRRLGEPYASAKLIVTVGDRCDLPAVRRENRWSEKYNIEWVRVPDDVFGEFGIYGTANWRLCEPSPEAEVIILCDADTVLMRDLGPLLASFPMDRPAVRGHMAHTPPRTLGTGIPDFRTVEYWPYLFGLFHAPWPNRFYRYSMDAQGQHPLSPAYFNLGFVAMNPSALSIFNSEILSFERRFKAVAKSKMRCQIALTILAYIHAMDIDVLTAEYNAANDAAHLSYNNIAIPDIRVLHYLREEEINRERIFCGSGLDEFLNANCANPVNLALQGLARRYRTTLSDTSSIQA